MHWSSFNLKFSSSLNSGTQFQTYSDKHGEYNNNSGYLDGLTSSDSVESSLSRGSSVRSFHLSGSNTRIVGIDGPTVR